MGNTCKVERAKGFEPSTLTLATCEARLETFEYASRDAKILASAAKEYFSGKPTGERYWRELQRRFETEILPALGTYRLVSAISKQDIRDLLKKKAKRYPAAARTMWDGLRPFFKWCASEDYTDHSPMADLLPPSLSPARDRVLTEDELRL